MFPCHVSVHSALRTKPPLSTILHPLSRTSMEIVQSSGSFKVVNGKLEFSCVEGIVRLHQTVYAGKWKNRQTPPGSLSDLYDVKQVQLDDRGPKIQLSWTVALEQDCYVKTPSLFDYANAPDLEGRIRREVETCEILRQYPHPNVTSYYGCLTTRGRVSGLCFKRYVSTLADKVSP